MVLDLRVLKFRAARFTRYPVTLTASKTASRVALLTTDGLLKALDIVAVETPATFATS